MPSRKHFLVFAGFVLAAMINTWPLTIQAGSHIPLGSESAATVPLFNLWTLGWQATSLRAGYAEVWNAPIFYPEEGALALSDPQFLTGLLFSVFYYPTGSRLLAYNLVLLSFLALNGFSVYLLCRTLGFERAPSFLSGLLGLSMPFVANEFGVMQLVPLFPPVMALGALIQFGKRPESKTALQAGLWTAAVFLTSTYYGLFWSLFAPLAACFFCGKRLLQWKVLLYLLGSGLVAALVLLPFLWPQHRLTQNYTRSDNSITANSAYAQDYLQLNPNLLGAELAPWLHQGSGQKLYPGTGYLMLGLLGLWAGSRKDMRLTWFLAGAATLAFILSTGLHLELFGWQPYELIREKIPGYAQLRSPFRFAAFCQIFLTALAGLGLGYYWRRGGRVIKSLFLLAGFLTLLEVHPLPLRTYSHPDLLESPAWVEWLARQPQGAVVMFPFPEGRSVGDFEATVMAMVLSLEHGKPLANGYSGFFPDSYYVLRTGMGFFPTHDTLEKIKDLAPVYLVVDAAWWSTTKMTKLENLEADLVRLYQDKNKIVFFVEQ